MNANPAASTERKLVLLFCLAAAFHVFVFSAAFPFFDNLDEPMHFDAVLKYSHGHVPRTLETVSPDSSVYLTLFSSYAYRNSPDDFPGHQMPPPLWTETPEVIKQVVASTSPVWQKQTNYECSQPPLYYLAGGGWWNLGKALGFHNERLLYWLRFLNIALVAGVVWLGYAAARRAFPENSFLRLGVPALIAFMPQSAFYSIENDAPSAVTFGIAFICLLRWIETPSTFWGAGTFLALAASYLTKATNFPLLAVAAAAVLAKIWLCRKSIRPRLPALILSLCCASLPVIGWTIWCKAYFGDLTGSAIKVHNLGWTLKPISQWLNHPIFTMPGAWAFFCGNVDTFWQGEFTWHNHQLRLPASDIVYTLASLTLMVAALTAMMSQFRKMAPLQRCTLGLSVAAIVMAFGFFGFMSIIYDFHDCAYPSRAYPYFASGRYLLGALIPILLLIVYGLDRLLNRFGSAVKFTALAVIILTMVTVEIVTDWPVFASPYNWYHLP